MSDSGKAFRDFFVGDLAGGEVGVLEKLGMSVEQFAVACGLTRSSFYYYLQGKMLPSSATIHKMAEVTGEPVEKLFNLLPTREAGGQRTKKRRG